MPQVKNLVPDYTDHPVHLPDIVRREVMLALEDLSAHRAGPAARVRPLLVAVVVLGPSHLLAADLAGDDLGSGGSLLN